MNIRTRYPKNDPSVCTGVPFLSETIPIFRKRHPLNNFEEN